MTNDKESVLSVLNVVMQTLVASSTYQISALLDLFPSLRIETGCCMRDTGRWLCWRARLSATSGGPQKRGYSSR